MNTRFANLTVKAAAVAVAGLALALGGHGTIEARHDDADNYFERQSIPAGQLTGTNPFDPYAPVDLGGSIATFRAAGITLNVDHDDAALDPCSPMRCKAW